MVKTNIYQLTTVVQKQIKKNFIGFNACLVRCSYFEILMQKKRM